ncbi:MAG: hypothetical protein ACYTGX_09480 [Planctomycetota bacterium]
MRSLRNDLLLAAGAVAVLLTAFGLGQGCRPERPEGDGEKPGVKGTEDPPKDPNAPDIPDEPVVGVRKKLQSEGYTVITVDKTVFFSWLDGELAAGPDLELMINKLQQEKKDIKLAVLFAQSGHTPWAGLVAIRERIDRLGLPYKMLFADHPGLAPAVEGDAAGAGAMPPMDGPPGPGPGPGALASGEAALQPRRFSVDWGVVRWGVSC